MHLILFYFYTVRLGGPHIVDINGRVCQVLVHLRSIEAQFSCLVLLAPASLLSKLMRVVSIFSLLHNTPMPSMRMLRIELKFTSLAHSA